MSDILCIIKKMKHAYAGHIVRQNAGRWSRKVLEWTPWDERRGQGRPATCWGDCPIKEWGEYRSLGEKFERPLPKDGCLVLYHCKSWCSLRI